MVSIFKVSSDVPRCPPLLEEIEHGRSTAENRTYAPKDIINYYCEEGYRTTSQSWRACALKIIRHTYSAVWLGVTPRCEEITCPSLRGYIENGAAFATSNMVGANATFRCDSGYELIGDSRLTCTRTGRWNGPIPVCDTGENHCPVLGIPLNGYKTGDRYNANDGVEFYCNAGYTLIGSQFRSCRPTGMWSGEPVKCIGKYVKRGFINENPVTDRAVRGALPTNDAPGGPILYLWWRRKIHRKLPTEPLKESEEQIRTNYIVA
ncbi:complement factor B-2 [Apostichopus japonicus]|uniref:Complement factor B-2 n=1 Tax=Stichopus japonicus TaxID=307972 RepID=A0A2G8LDA1_STIJA|nr:complement factor B-2 [Apostichopus japonicus]